MGRRGTSGGGGGVARFEIRGWAVVSDLSRKNRSIPGVHVCLSKVGVDLDVMKEMQTKGELFQKFILFSHRTENIAELLKDGRFAHIWENVFPKLGAACSPQVEQILPCIDADV